MKGAFMSNPNHFRALLDALQWLTFQQTQGQITLLGKNQKKVFSIDRSFAVHSLALIFNNTDKHLTLAMRDEEHTQWFGTLPWLKVQVYNRKSAFLNVICKQVKFPHMEEIKFKGGELPVFSLKVPIYSKYN